MKRLTVSRIDLNALESETGFGWAWFVALGMALMTFALLAFVSVPAGTTGPLYAVGIVMCFGALAQLGTPLVALRWRGFEPLVLSAVFYGWAAVVVIANPILAGTGSTLVLGLALLLSGFMRILLAVGMPYLPGWGWVGASGVVTLGAGLVFMGWSPADSVWLDGIVLAMDLSFQGLMTIGFGITLKAIAE
jgi:uncharacterized membrane protein HdeD (DUF308 family)